MYEQENCFGGFDVVYVAEELLPPPREVPGAERTEEDRLLSSVSTFFFRPAYFHCNHHSETSKRRSYRTTAHVLVCDETATEQQRLRWKCARESSKAYRGKEYTKDYTKNILWLGILQASGFIFATGYCENCGYKICLVCKPTTRSESANHVC